MPSAVQGPIPNVFAATLDRVVSRYKIDRFSDDARCLHYEALMRWAKEARLDSSMTRPDPVDIVTARDRCRASIGPTLRRRVYGKLFTVDRTGMVHFSPVVPSQRFAPPYLIRTFRGVGSNTCPN